MKYIIVNSVKGGCGKSSISLRTAIELAMATKEIEVKNKKTGKKEKKKIYANNVLVIDMDILGSSLRTFVTGELFKQELNDKTTSNKWTKKDLIIGTKANLKQEAYWLLQDEHAPQEEQDKGDPICFSDIFCKKYEDYKSKRIETPFRVCPCLEKNEEDDADLPLVHIAFSSENQTVKNRFRAQKSNNYTPNVNVRYYEEVLRKYIKYLGEKALSNGKPATHIIFDMPPNSDPYSDCVFSLLLKKIKDGIQNKVVDKKRDTVELRVVSSCDLSHIGANLLWMENIFDKNGWQYALPNEISFIINDITGATSVEGAKDVRVAMLKKVGIALRWTVFDTIAKKILWHDRDDVLILSSACKSCVAFSRKPFVDCSTELEKIREQAESNDGTQPSFRNDDN